MEAAAAVARKGPSVSNVDWLELSWVALPLSASPKAMVGLQYILLFTFFKSIIEKFLISS